MRRLLLPSALALSSLLAACAQTVGNERVDWDHGARHARVLETVAPPAAEAEAHACLGARPLPDGQQFVRVRYRLNRLHRNAVAIAPAGLALRAGDEVELWPDDCDAGQLARVERVLPPLPQQPPTP